MNKIKWYLKYTWYSLNILVLTPLVWLQSKYDAYKEGNNGFKIDLNKNFRSRGEVLDSINQIFNHIMDDNIGNANYIKEHQLIFGNNTFIEEGNNNYNNNLEIYNYLPDPNFTKEEMEAFIIANDIKKKVTSNYEVFDKTLRPCKYSDFYLLMQSHDLHLLFLYYAL